jgi:hypothetical protein
MRSHNLHKRTGRPRLGVAAPRLLRETPAGDVGQCIDCVDAWHKEEEKKRKKKRKRKKKKKKT